MSSTASRFEHFEILKDEKGELIKLGLGGMGTTYRAYDMHLRKLVALKIINERTLADSTARRRFFNEARAAASIDHPNVARVIFLCPEDAAQCSFAMELVEGETLARRISQHGVMAAGTALFTLRPIADALLALGARDLVHRDIKPENIMTTGTVDGRSEVKLIDFGLAKTTSNRSSILESVHTGERFVGSAYFASPEQFSPESGVDCRSDFYSLGATLWHCVTGAPPFTGTFFEVHEAHTSKEPPWPKIADLPPALTVLLRRLLARDPNDRPADARALLAAWDEAASAIEAAATFVDLPAGLEDADEEDADEEDADEGPSGSVLETSTIAAFASPFRRPEQTTPPFTLPAGATPPPPSGTLAMAPGGSGARFIRRIPSTLAPELLAALKRAALSARDVDHAGLLAVREIEATSIAVEWPVSVTGAQVATWHGSALPASIMLAWLPHLASAIDAAHTRGLMHLGLQPDRILVAYDSAAAPQAKPADLAWWQSAQLWIDPLAAFDSALVATNRNLDAGGASRRAPACSTVREYIAALGRCVRDLMGGLTDGRAQPIAGFDEVRNQLVVEAISYRVNTRTCSEWAQHLVEGFSPARIIPATLPDLSRDATATVLPQSRPATQPPAVLAVEEARVPGPVPARRGAMRPAIFVALGVLCVALLGGGIWALVSHGKRTGEMRGDELRTLMSDGDAAVSRRDFSHASFVAAAVERLAPADPWLADFRERMERIRPVETPMPGPKLTPFTPMPKQAATPIPATPAPLSTPVPVATHDPAEATRNHPFASLLGIPFVPVRIIGGPSHGSVVLFSVYETRVRDFEQFAEAKIWQRVPNQTDDDPAVNVLSVEAVRFAAWLTRREKLPPGWFYRLPTDHEWSCAVGIGELENPQQSASGKSGNFPQVHPWGNDWPPPAGSGNFADVSLKGTPFPWIDGYSDGFKATSPVGSFAMHRSGLYDLAGNAAEWCQDDNASATHYVLRGGSWATFEPRELLSSHRTRLAEDARAPDQGFRLVLTNVRISAPRNSGVRPANGGATAPIINPNGR